MRRGAPFVLGAAAIACLALTTGVVYAEDEAPEAAAGETADAADPAAVLQKLDKEYQEARRAYYASRRAKPVDGVKPEPLPPAEKVMWPRYRDAAEQFAGQPGAAPLLVRVVQYARTQDEAACRAALDTLVEKHVTSDAWPQLTYTFLRYAAQIDEELVGGAMQAVIDAAAHDDAVTAMLFARGAAVTRQSFDDDAERAAALESSLADLRRAVEIAPEGSWGKRSASTIFELTRLQIGMETPDIAGEDLDGVAFKLSDYRGKVVVLDFWGDW